METVINITKQCKECFETKELSLFKKQRKVCISCYRLDMKRRYSETKIARNISSKKYYIDNKEKQLKYAREYYIDNKEKIIRYNIDYYNNNKEYILKKYHLNNKKIKDSENCDDEPIIEEI
jgi:hypothetical protein